MRSASCCSRAFRWRHSRCCSSGTSAPRASSSRGSQEQEAAAAFRSTVDDVARATGPFPHWHNLAGYLLLILLLGVSLLHERDQRVMRRPLLALVLAPAFVALGQTASIAPLLGLVVGAFLIASYVGRDTTGLLVAVGVVAIAGNDCSSSRCSRPHRRSSTKRLGDREPDVPAADDLLQRRSLDDPVLPHHPRQPLPGLRPQPAAAPVLRLCGVALRHVPAARRGHPAAQRISP